MKMNDPWQEVDNESKPTRFLKFENNFCPVEKLPDSEHYLSILERKLERLQGKDKDLSSADVVNRLQNLRDDLMMNFMQEDQHPDEVSHRHINSNYVERRMFPERQALTEEELLELVKSEKPSGVQDGRTLDDFNQER